jgi:hypothetical protein
VELTLTLNKLWVDESERRTRMGVREPVRLFLDKSRNRENQGRALYPEVN